MTGLCAGEEDERFVFFFVDESKEEKSDRQNNQNMYAEISVTFYHEVSLLKRKVVLKISNKTYGHDI